MAGIRHILDRKRLLWAVTGVRLPWALYQHDTHRPWHDFSASQPYERDTGAVETRLQIFEFWSLPGWARCGAVLSRDMTLPNRMLMEMFKADQAKPCCSAGQMHQMHFLYYDIWYFQLPMGLWGPNPTPSWGRFVHEMTVTGSLESECWNTEFLHTVILFGQNSQLEHKKIYS